METSLLSKMPPPAKNVWLYKNGDSFYKGRKFVVNRRQVNNMDSFLEYATDTLKPAFGAVRNIYTPAGGTRITKLENIESGKRYVAGGPEAFRPLKSLKYEEIGTRRAPHIKKTYSHIKPVTHSQAHGNITGRWRQVADEINHPIQLWLHVNGDSISSPVKMLLPSRILKLKFDMILQYITDRVGIRLGSAVRRLHDTNGNFVGGVKDLVNGATYVATGNERFRRMPYRQGGASHSAPVLKRKPLPPLKAAKKQHTPRNQYKNPEYDNIVDKIVSEKSNTNHFQEPFENKPIKVKPKENTTSKPNSKRRQEYVEEADDIQVEIPVEKQIADEVKPAQVKRTRPKKK